jgi:hypothetical protein
MSNFSLDYLFNAIPLLKISLLFLAVIMLFVLYSIVKGIIRSLRSDRSLTNYYDSSDDYYKQTNNNYERPRSSSHSTRSSRKPQIESTDLVMNVATNMAIYSAIDDSNNSSSHSSSSSSYSSGSDSSSSSSDSSSSYSFD